jgi:hypothetical protein
MKGIGNRFSLGISAVRILSPNGGRSQGFFIAIARPRAFSAPGVAEV